MKLMISFILGIFIPFHHQSKQYNHFECPETTGLETLQLTFQSCANGNCAGKQQENVLSTNFALVMYVCTYKYLYKYVTCTYA